MLKIQFAVGLALAVGIITFIISVMNDARPATILYRTVISLSVFGVFGYLLGIITEKFLFAQSDDLKSTGQKVDIISDQDNTTLNNDPVFDPFTPDNFEHISSSKD